MEPPQKKLRQEDEKEQTGWFDLPYEMRLMILDEVCADDLLKFAICSKQCDEEISASRQYFNEIILHERTDCVDITLQRREDRYGYSVTFTTIGSTHTEVVFNRNVFTRVENRCLGKIYIKKRRNDVVVDYLKQYLRRIGRSLTFFYIGARQLLRNNIVRNIKLRNLQKLGNLSLAPCTKPTCLLKMEFVDMQQILYVTNYLSIHGMMITFEQLSEIKAKSIEVSYSSLTPQDLNKYVKLWMEGKLHKNFKSLKVYACAPRARKHPQRKIEFVMDGLENDAVMENNFFVDLRFTVKSSVEHLKHLKGRVIIDKSFTRFEFSAENR